MEEFERTRGTERRWSINSRWKFGCRRPVWKALIGSYSNIAAIKKFLSPADELELSLLCSVGSKIRGRRSIHREDYLFQLTRNISIFGCAKARESRLLFPFPSSSSRLQALFVQDFAQNRNERVKTLKEYLFRRFVCEKEAKLRRVRVV